MLLDSEIVSVRVLKPAASPSAPVFLVFLALALACAPQVHPDTARAIASVESGFNPYAIGVVAGAMTVIGLELGCRFGTLLGRRMEIVGGLILSQALTLFTTPVVYLFFDRLKQRSAKTKERALPEAQPA